MPSSLTRIIAAGDRDVVAGFYDARAASVREYCAELCPPELVDEATLGAFVHFLGRARNEPDVADAEELLRRSTRLVAASRMPPRDRRDAACDGVAELLAARAGAELPHDDRALTLHLASCRSCRGLVDQLAQAEDALVRTPTTSPAEEVRTAWLELASREQPPTSERPESVAASRGGTASTARLRQGGLVGAVRRFAGSARRRMS